MSSGIVDCGSFEDVTSRSRGEEEVKGLGRRMSIPRTLNSTNMMGYIDRVPSHKWKTEQNSYVGEKPKFARER